MPRAGVSTEFLEEREDDIAVMLAARDHVERLRVLGAVLAERNAITRAYYRDYLDSLDLIAAALLKGKRAAATLRGWNHE